jgi:beta-glucosidase-like glycosyl hydrolase|tara:strand:- start:1048 stop:1188 length:141 start_codon:yes stop_codon:yes gene_type:complete
MRNDVDKGLITDFPSALAIAATWDKDASYLYAKTMANEFSNKGAKI